MKKQILTGAGVLMVAAALQGQTRLENGGTAFQFAGVFGEKTILIGGESFGGQTVTGKPFSAVEERHSIQTLGDGTRIESSETNHLYRDEQGRTRIERAGGNISIHDPVARFNAELDPKTKTASKLSMPIPIVRTADGVLLTTNTDGGLSSQALKLAAAPPPALRTESGDTLKSPQLTVARPNVVFYSDLAPVSVDDAKKQAEAQFSPRLTITTGAHFAVSTGQSGSIENLPGQMINGILSQGTRTTETIPVGKIGNDRAISIVNERWYSNDLQMLVKSTSSDPRFGDTTYQLTNIVQTSPDPSLFQIGGDYTIRK